MCGVWRRSGLAAAPQACAAAAWPRRSRRGPGTRLVAPGAAALRRGPADPDRVPAALPRRGEGLVWQLRFSLTSFSVLTGLDRCRLCSGGEGGVACEQRR